ncbi:hypothetical protein KI387_025143, partial [Taxus chinensis]
MDGQDVAENSSHTTAPTRFPASYQEGDDMDFELEGVPFPQSLDLFSLSVGVMNQ